MSVSSVTWIDEPVVGRVLVQCSAHGEPRAATIESSGVPGDEVIAVQWDEPQRRVAPGQSIVFYTEDDTVVLGGGIGR
jgi:tRNA-specific 2-thiouridylase